MFQTAIDNMSPSPPSSAPAVDPSVSTPSPVYPYVHSAILPTLKKHHQNSDIAANCPSSISRSENVEDLFAISEQLFQSLGRQDAPTSSTVDIDGKRRVHFDPSPAHTC